jgi:hypothetical protein
MTISKIKKIINILLEAEMQSNINNDEPYGKILFSPQRVDGVDTTEPNTAEEEELKYAIQSQYTGLGSKELGNYAIDMQTLLHKGKYTEILKPSPGYVYRILSDLTLEEVSSMVGESPANIQKNTTDRPWIIEKNHTFS